MGAQETNLEVVGATPRVIRMPICLDSMVCDFVFMSLANTRCSRTTQYMVIMKSKPTQRFLHEASYANAIFNILSLCSKNVMTKVPLTLYMLSCEISVSN